MSSSRQEPRTQAQAASGAEAAGAQKPKSQKAKAVESRKHPGKHYIFQDRLGKGTQATVWKFNMEGNIFAGKVTSNDWIFEERHGDPNYWRKRMLSLCREFIFLQMIDSPNVIRLEEIIRTRSNYYCILEYANGGSLQNLLNAKQRFSEPVARKCIKQIIDGCSALYELCIMHRDMKLDNILVHFPDRPDNEPIDLATVDLENENFLVKIADLGYAREFKAQENATQSEQKRDRAFSFKGSPLMMPAEQIQTYWGRGSGYSHKIDVWAIGVIFYQMLTGMFIFNVTEKTSYQMALQILYRKIKEGTWTWPTDIKITLQCFEFLCQTMQQDPFMRPSWEEMKDHPFFTSTEQTLIPLDIIFDQEPPEGLKFSDGKIYVNTKDPSLYQKLHQAAVEKYIQENGEGADQIMNKVLADNQKTAELFPRISKHLTAEPIAEQLHEDGTASEAGSSVQQETVLCDDDEASSAMHDIGITKFAAKQTEKERIQKEYQQKIKDPQKYLANNVPEIRDTFQTDMNGTRQTNGVPGGPEAMKKSLVKSDNNIPPKVNQSAPSTKEKKNMTKGQACGEDGKCIVF